jgi:hypothetical protein
MFADFLINEFPLMESATILSKIILHVHGKAQPRTNYEHWPAEPEKNTESADGTGPAVSRDAQSSRR